MAKQFGLITPNKDKIKVILRPSIFDDDSDSDGGPAAKPTGLKKTLKKQDKITQSKAVTEDPTVYQYDEIYDAMDQKRKESKLSRKDLDKKPKYISRLLQAAEKRKKDNERRIERQVQKEREAEGEEFKDKESFVTTAYRKKLEEMKEEEELEKREEYLEAIGDVTKQGNLDGFYRHLYEQKVKYEDNEEIKQEAAKESDEDEKQKEETTDTTNKQEETKKNRKRKYRQREQSKGDSDDEATEQVEEVKKEHLPSNLDADSDFSIDSSDSEDEQNKSVPVKADASKNGSGPVAEENKDKSEEKVQDKENKEEEEKTDKAKVDTEVAKEETKEEIKENKPKKPKIDIWKKRTVGEAFDAALMRYFERKSARQV